MKITIKEASTLLKIGSTFRFRNDKDKICEITSGQDGYLGFRKDGVRTSLWLHWFHPETEIYIGKPPMKKICKNCRYSFSKIKGEKDFWKDGSMKKDELFCNSICSIDNCCRMMIVLSKETNPNADILGIRFVVNKNFGCINFEPTPHP